MPIRNKFMFEEHLINLLSWIGLSQTTKNLFFHDYFYLFIENERSLSLQQSFHLNMNYICFIAFIILIPQHKSPKNFFCSVIHSYFYRGQNLIRLLSFLRQTLHESRKSLPRCSSSVTILFNDLRDEMSDWIIKVL